MFTRLSAAALPLIAAACTTAATPDEPTSLIVNITAEIREGAVMMALFDSAEAYDSGAPVAGAGGSVSEGTLALTFEDLEPGTYAIRAYHDLNGNGELDTNLTGMPTEPFAFSNNAPVNYGPPSFEDAAFEVTPGANTHAISIR
ncbi:MAG: DUF2141 domain-containing protein [Parvularcula sp.]|jgi:uncharacterized protein (DUF2141 family)|nr:DUF2141 domain-containing protein [Parvularcula sp.]